MRWLSVGYTGKCFAKKLKFVFELFPFVAKLCSMDANRGGVPYRPFRHLDYIGGLNVYECMLNILPGVLSYTDFSISSDISVIASECSECITVASDRTLQTR